MAVAYTLQTLSSSPNDHKSAANALLDRAYGKPSSNEERSIPNLPPMVIELTSPNT